jgi:hypothetical protein
LNAEEAPKEVFCCPKAPPPNVDVAGVLVDPKSPPPVAAGCPKVVLVVPKAGLAVAPKAVFWPKGFAAGVLVPKDVLVVPNPPVVPEPKALWPNILKNHFEFPLYKFSLKTGAYYLL